MEYDAIIVGGGIAGLISAAYLAKNGYQILLLEKEDACGGLVNSFTRDGFVYDGGIRAMENSGILFPMIKDLGLDIDYVHNKVTLGIEDKIIAITSEENLEDYHDLLCSLYPENIEDIAKITAEIRKIMDYMEVQYSIDNPAFLDMKKDRDYMIKNVVPWIFKYMFTVPKINKYNLPVNDFLRNFTSNQSLLDIISQHFFQETPAFFALSYIKLYLDYHYPIGGTIKLPEKLVNLINQYGGNINNGTTIIEVDVVNRIVSDQSGNNYHYKQLIWAADQRTFYSIIKKDNMTDQKLIQELQHKDSVMKDKVGNDSVLTLFLGTNIDPVVLSSKISGHFFYTPSRKGQSLAGKIPVGKDKKTILSWLEEFLALTTYEISIPVLRDPSLAPPGKSGFVISVLFDYSLTKHIDDMGWYQDFKSKSESIIIRTLQNSIFPEIKGAIIHQFLSTPMTMERLSGNFMGAITGWSFTNHPLPAESRLPKIMSSTRTQIPNVFQAGQWTYSPSGLPISILTGKLAADGVQKELKRKQ